MLNPLSVWWLVLAYGPLVCAVLLLAILAYPWVRRKVGCYLVHRETSRVLHFPPVTAARSAELHRLMKGQR